MGTYSPHSDAERKEMMHFLGISSIDELYCDIPEKVRLKEKLELPQGKSEIEAMRIMAELASMNKVFKTIYRGAGAYNHYVPSIVRSVAGKERFLTTYTPYQPEISQGVLQSIFEFQTIVCELTGMDTANASVYDGSSAAAEAALMCADNRKNTVLVSSMCKPDTIATIKTYCKATGRNVVVIPAINGDTGINMLKQDVDNVACLYVEMPNYYGIMEDYELLGQKVHELGGKFIIGVNPMSLGIYKTPADFGADIAVGDAQPLGLTLSFGGPYLGFMACKSEMTRKLPGRMVGETVDRDGRRAYVLTLQAREQHIRREKASSNICSNQANCALTAAAYIGAMGSVGFEKVSGQCYSKAHYAATEIGKIKAFELVYENKEFFNEFVTKCDIDKNKLMGILEDNDILGGLPIDEGILWCVTELNTKEDIDLLVSILREVAE